MIDILPGTSIALIGAFFRLAVLSIVLERALSFLFEVRLAPPLWLRRRWCRSRNKPEPKDTDDMPLLSDFLGSPVKAVLTYAAALLLCMLFDFDIFTAIFPSAPSKHTSLVLWLTAAVVAGGSAGAIKLFQDVLGLSKTARDASRDAREAEAQARLSKAQADKAIADVALQQAQQQKELLEVTGSTALKLAQSGQTAPQTSFHVATSQPWSLRPTPSLKVGVKSLPALLKLP